MNKSQILIDCVYLNSEGGKKILEIILNNLESRLSFKHSFLFDDRIDKNILRILRSNEINLIKPSEIERRRFYIANKSKFKKVVCLANVPPPINLESNVLIYFHNELLLKPTKSGSFKSMLILLVKKIYIKYKNVARYRWIVQTKFMKDGLSFFLGIKKNKIEIFPIFQELLPQTAVNKSKRSFLYVCSSARHKNLNRLIKAFNLIENSKYFDLHLHLTIADNKYFINNVFAKNTNHRLKIINHGIVNQPKLSSLYHKSEFLIFPSLIESFGLPLIESVGYNCKVIASDLPYVYQVIQPSIIFNPYVPKSIANAIDKAILDNNIPDSKLIIKNKIDKFIDLIEN